MSRVTLSERQPEAPDGPSEPTAFPSAIHPTSLLDADQLAVRWQVSKAQVYRLARDGQLPTVRIGRYYRWRLAAIEAWELESEAAIGERVG